MILGGQLFETQISSADGDYVISSGGTPGRTSNPNHPLGLYEVANVIKYEHVPADATGLPTLKGGYTYTVGAGGAAYTRKIDFYERELLYLRPDVFVVFDRVQTVDPTYRKVWAAHTVDPPTVADLSPSPGPGHGDLHGRHPDRHRQPGERHPHRHPAPGAEPGHHPRRGHTARKVIHPTLRK